MKKQIIDYAQAKHWLQDYSPPKIHKTEIPLRPIVSANGSPTLRPSKMSNITSTTSHWTE